jgi:2-keto-4-pentenoate hydratase/2-oxohepta-3-ene-1,7-dioic acid hydratase in catechol pathway
VTNLRVCRFIYEGRRSIGLFYDSEIIDLRILYQHFKVIKKNILPGLEPFPSSILQILPPNQNGYEAIKILENFYQEYKHKNILNDISLSIDEINLLSPIPKPRKLFFLAGNYAEHIKEGEGKASGATFIAHTKKDTFPYFFMKPVTTITNPGDSIILPKISQSHIDWEVELGVIMGKRAKYITSEKALEKVAGYTIINDVSDRKFRPNPNRKERPMDGFFDWLHGKWHDSFAPTGPCITSSEDIPDPQSLDISLMVNGKLKQHSNTFRMIFTVADLIEFISNIVTLEPGDIISTGTPAGIGATTGTFLKHGDIVKAKIEKIGVLENPVSAC